MPPNPSLTSWAALTVCRLLQVPAALVEFAATVWPAAAAYLMHPCEEEEAPCSPA